MRQFTKEVNRVLSEIDTAKLDKKFLSSREFSSLAVQSYRAASEADSDLKIQTLANALCNCVIPPISKDNNKATVLRTISHLSDTEIYVLSYFFRNTIQEKRLKLNADKIALELSWPKQNVVVACEGLIQLGVARLPPVSWDDMPSGSEGDSYSITELGIQTATYAMRSCQIT